MKRALKTTFAVIILVLSLSAPLSAGALEDADAAAGRGDYASAVRLLRPLADQGHAKAQSNLGFMYEYGIGVPQNYAEALTWYRKAADQGDAYAQNSLGLMYNRGLVVPRDYAEAVKWLRKAADQGNAHGQTFLGMMYQFGNGVPQDDAEAAKWYRKAADQGYANGQFSLGLSYKYGRGVPQDYVSAYMWLNLSAASQPAAIARGATAAKHRDEVASKMTPAQIAEAQKLAREWKPVSPHPPWQKLLDSGKP